MIKWIINSIKHFNKQQHQNAKLALEYQKLELKKQELQLKILKEMRK